MTTVEASLLASFSDFAQRYRERIDAILAQACQDQPPAAALQQAIRYSLVSGGKRVRPLLTYAAAMAVGETTPLTDRAAAALECIHAYSLIHDDLPAMDDDDLRRGKPTCHIAFDEATAILAGDALQALAFEQLSTAEAAADPSLQLRMVAILAKASGDKGMVAGQAIDLAAVNQQLDLNQLQQMHSLKTGALITASVQLGALSTGVASASQLHALTTYGNTVGLAFQIQDDILDVTADTATLGKPQGADQDSNKPTFVSLLGLETAQAETGRLFNEALDSLGNFDYRADPLRDLAAYIIKRQH